MLSTLALSVLVIVAAAVSHITQRGTTTETRDFSSSSAVDDSPGQAANVSVGDLDGDGDLDLVLAKGRHWQSASRVLLNDGAGRFTSRDIGIARDSSYAAEIADLDGDQDLDIVVANEGLPGRVFLNDGRAGFVHASDWGSAAWRTRMVALADLDGDRRPDIVAPVSDPIRGTRSAFCLNDGRGMFPSCSDLPFGPATKIVPADFDRDGDVDLAYPPGNAGQGLIAYNDGRAGFARTLPFGPEKMSARVGVAADLNRDSWPDLVVGDDVAGVVIYLNDGRGGLGAGHQVRLREVVRVMALAIADVNRDGSDDIVAGYTSAPGSILLNDGTGLAFLHARFGERSGSVYGVAVADVNGDGHVDVAAARSGAPSTVHISRSGGTSASVSTSAAIVSPVPLFEPRPLDARTSLAGVWSGTATQRGQGSITFGIELLIENSGDRMTGRRLTHEGGIVYCTSSLILEERPGGDQYVFRETFEAGFCLTGAIRLRRVSENDLQFELFPGTDSKPIATAALKRKQ